MTQDVSLPWWLPSARSFSLNSVLFWVLSPRPCVCVCLLHHWAASPADAFILGLSLCLLLPLGAQLLSPSWAGVSVFLWWFFSPCYHHLLLRGIQIAPGRLFDIVLRTLRPHYFICFSFFFYRLDRFLSICFPIYWIFLLLPSICSEVHAAGFHFQF